MHVESCLENVIPLPLLIRADLHPPLRSTGIADILQFGLLSKIIQIIIIQNNIQAPMFFYSFIDAVLVCNYTSSFSL